MEIVKQILEKEQIKFEKIVQTKNQFLVDNKLIVKLATNKTQNLFLQTEFKVLKNCNFDFLQSVVGFGKYKNYHYIISNYINEKSVLEKWKTYKTEEKEQIIKILAQNLKKIHKIDQSFLQKQMTDANWQQHWHTEFEKIILLFERFNLNTLNLKNFVAFNLDEIFEHNIYGLINNNLSLDNLIYSDGKLLLTNFEKARFCAVDYELNNLTLNLKNFVTDNQEKSTHKNQLSEKDIAFILEKFKKFYPEIFNIPKIEERLWIYNFYSNIKYALKNDEPKLVEFELESFNQFYKNFDLPKRNLIDNLEFEIVELNRIYQKDFGIDLYKTQILPAVHFAKKLAKDLGADLGIVKPACLVFNVASLKQEGGYLNYHINSAQIAKTMLEKYGCSETNLNKILGCILNHKSIKTTTNANEKCVALAVLCAIFSNLIAYCKNYVANNPNTKFGNLKLDLTEKYSELDKNAKQYLKINLDKELNKVFKALFNKQEKKEK